MKSSLLFLVIPLILSLQGCELLKNSAKPATTIVVSELVKKNRASINDLEYIANGLETLSKTLNKTASIEDFNKLIKDKNNKEIVILVDYIYNIYKDKIIYSDKLEVSRKIILDISEGIRSGILLNIASK